ncbi:PhnA domain-containing protein [Aliikangiella coralliicola]|uniref:PhnA domain protein n=1 Tax=Aliikangiella coralliicola TaxID=2592383 RepID=A0A545UAA5_9GAMM|nr:alkylphosphonate utilization protein [Aliikangiella coralliicola]TQV86369.1 PhnA domain protein [Aliikangiella coralliicola]
MTIMHTLMQRADSQCELCKAVKNLAIYEVPPTDSADSDKCILVCESCHAQINGDQQLDVNHWRCLNDSMWSQVPAVQIVAWRMLKRLSSENWAQDLLDMLYLDEAMLTWAESGISDESDEATLDSNGAVLQAGDTVTLIKDLEVKGAGFTAKRGTAVRNISLTSNPLHIEGRVNGTRIVLVAKYLKKSN